MQYILPSCAFLLIIGSPRIDPGPIIELRLYVSPYDPDFGMYLSEAMTNV